MATASRADEVHKASRERDRTGNGAAASEPMVTVPHLRRTWGYMGKDYGPGDNVEIPRGLAINLGLTFSEAQSRPATDVAREAPPIPNAPEPEVDGDGKLVGTMPSASAASEEAAAEHEQRVHEETIRRAQETGEGVHDALAHRLEPGETMAQPNRLDHALASGADDGEDKEDMIHGDSVANALKAKGGGKGGIGEESSPNVSAEERNAGYYEQRDAVTAGRRSSGGKAGKAKRKSAAKGGAKAKKGKKGKKGAKKKSAKRKSAAKKVAE